MLEDGGPARGWVFASSASFVAEELLLGAPAGEENAVGVLYGDRAQQPFFFAIIVFCVH